MIGAGEGFGPKAAGVVLGIVAIGVGSCADREGWSDDEVANPPSLMYLSRLAAVSSTRNDDGET